MNYIDRTPDFLQQDKKSGVLFIISHGIEHTFKRQKMCMI